MWEIPSSACLGGTEGKWACLLTARSSGRADPVVVWATTVESVLAGEPSAPGSSGDRRPPSSFLLNQFCKTVAEQGDQLWVLSGYWGERVWWISGIMAQNKGNESWQLMFSGWERSTWSWAGFFCGDNMLTEYHRHHRMRGKIFLGIFVKPACHSWSFSWDQSRAT